MARNKKKTPVQIQMDPAMKRLLQEIAEKEGRSMAKHAEYVLTLAIHEYMDKHAEAGDLPEANDAAR